MAQREYTREEYETLQRSEREIAGNEEVAVVEDVFIGDDLVRLSLRFDWKRDTEAVEFVLDRERDVLELQSVTGALGYEYDQLPHVEGERLPVVYLDGGWVPAAALPDSGPARLTETGTATPDSGPSLAAWAARTLGGWVDDITAKKVVLGVIITKKLLIASALVYLLVT
jgi:hypothetical protein